MTKSTSPKRRVVGRALDPAHDLLEARVGLLLGQLLLRDELVELALGDLAGLVEAVVDELLVDVLEDDVDVGDGDRLGDLASHRAGADDCSLEDEHSAPNVGLIWVVKVRGARRGEPSRGRSAAPGPEGYPFASRRRAPSERSSDRRIWRPDEEEVGDRRRAARRRCSSYVELLGDPASRPSSPAATISNRSRGCPRDSGPRTRSGAATAARARRPARGPVRARPRSSRQTSSPPGSG